MGALFSVIIGACEPAATPPPQQPTPYYGPTQPGQPYPVPSQVPPGPYPQQPIPQQPAAPTPLAQRPLLAPLVGVAAWQNELRSVLNELIAALSAQNQALVRGIPLVFDPTEEINAYAGCDEQGAPFLAATAGILEAADAMAQTKATDELFGTQTYEAYCAQVLPQVVRSDKASAALPAGLIPAQYGGDARRWSRAHEWYDEIVGFTFGHELSHHYLGHTGCAKGQGGSGPDPSKIGRILLGVAYINQYAEAAADSAGIYNLLDTGRARRPQFEWQEEGGLAMLDYFARLERAAGAGGLGSLFNPLAVLKTHPNPLLRIPLLQTVARTWHQQHP